MRKSSNTKTKIIAVVIGMLSIFLFDGIKGGILIAQELIPQIQADPQSKSDFSGLTQSIETGLEVERDLVAKLEKEVADLDKAGQTFSDVVNAFRVELSTHRNLINLPQTSLLDLEKAMEVHQTALDSVAASVKNLMGKRDIIAQRIIAAEEQYALNEKQLYQISIGEKGAAQAQATIDILQQLMRYLIKKIKYLETINEVYTEQLGILTSVRQDMMEFMQKFSAHLQSKKKEQLFSRGHNPLTILNWGQIIEELKGVSRNFYRILQRSYWQTTFSEIWKAGGFLFLSSVLFFVIVIIALMKLNRYMLRFANDPGTTAFPVRNFTFQIFRRSLIIFGILLCLYLFVSIRKLRISTPDVSLIFNAMSIWLFTEWIRSFVTNWNHWFTEKSIPDDIRKGFIKTIFLIRYAALIYVFLIWLLGPGSAVSFLGRFFFEIFVLAWHVNLWKKINRMSEDIDGNVSRTLKTIGMFIYFILVGGVLSELAGYGYLSVFWYTSWGYFSVIALWGILIFAVLQEWERNAGKQKSEKPNLSESLTWLFIRICWPIWFLIVLAAMISAWGGDQSLIFNLLKTLNAPVSIGGMQINPLGFVYAFIILSAIRAAILLWKQFLVNRFLPAKKYERGLKTSITSIVVYVFWGIGIIISLSLIGVSSASMAVVFGALGVGLGFGLQNIFNNFISGIILLFERPIQVGDSIEVNGIWGEVKKINIRSTVVQSFDNASLIIPNSEFISNQVTNWSFKDMRLRRKLNIGVAYGSNLELVCETLLEAARKTQNVLKDPEPNVVFLEYADSAIVFMLRYWTDVDHYYSTQTGILLEVDRLFRERNIEIPFPQRDLHLRSVDANAELRIHKETQPVFKPVSAPATQES